MDESKVFVLDNPISYLKQKGNLTGSTRLIKDHVADISNLIQQWNSELLSGMNIISEIRNLIFIKISKKSGNEKYSENLQYLSKNLEKICDNMELLVDKLEQKNHNFLSLHKLEILRSNSKPLFFSWPTHKFVEISQQIYEMYRREIKSKVVIKEEICFCSNKNLIIFYTTSWFHQPYIDKSVNLSLEIMLKEVGHIAP